MGLPGGVRAKKTQKGDPFVIRSGSQEGNCWVHFGAKTLTLSFVLTFVCDIFSDSKKAMKMELPQGGGTCNPTMPVHVS